MNKSIILLILVLSVGHTTYAQQTSMSDSQIEKILITINQGNIDAATVAVKKAQHEKVISFARMMLTDHKKNTSETKKMTKNFSEKSELADALKQEAKESNQELKKVDKAGFDRAYIDQQVLMHGKVLATLNEKLIPNAKSEKLVTHLNSTKAAVSHQLEEVQKISAELN